MNSDRQGVERLGIALRAAPRRPVGRDCPAADRIWQAVHGRLATDATGEIVDHLAVCPTCAEAWEIARLALEGAPAVSARRAERLSGPLAAAAAVVLLAGVGLLAWFGPGRPESGEPVLRTQPGGTIVSLVPEDVPLPRTDCVLRWSVAQPAGARYRVIVTNLRLDTLAHGRALGEPRFELSEAALEPVAAGELILWRVEAEFADGRHVSGPTFVVPIE